MGFLATVISFTRSVVAGAQAPEAKVDRGGGDSITAYHFSSPGDDSHPLPGDVVFVAEDEGSGNVQIVGYQDPKTSPVAAAGEKRIYARSAPGTVACEVSLRNDGTVVVRNTQATIELRPDGAVAVNGAQASIELGADGAASVTNALGSIDLDAAGNITLKNAVATLELKTSGEATVSNAVGSIKLDAAGLVTFTAPIGSVGSHTHAHSTPFGPSGPPIPNT